MARCVCEWYSFNDSFKKMLRLSNGVDLIGEHQWRAFLTMSAGWEHYAHHRPEPHIFVVPQAVRSGNEGFADS